MWGNRKPQASYHISSVDFPPVAILLALALQYHCLISPTPQTVTFYIARGHNKSPKFKVCLMSVCSENTNWLLCNYNSTDSMQSVINLFHLQTVKQHTALGVKALECLAFSYIDFLKKGILMRAQWKTELFPQKCKRESRKMSRNKCLLNCV